MSVNGDSPEPYIIPDTVAVLVRKERERIIQASQQPVDGCTYQQAVEQFTAWKQQVADLDDFMSHFGISFY